MLWMDYYVYLMKLPEIEREKQFFIMMIFFIIIILIGTIHHFIKSKNKGN